MNWVALQVPLWRNAVRYALPPDVVARAAERRAAGDWAGACAAARFEVRLDLDAVRGRYSAELVAALADDLRHLVPDLVHWHMPRRPAGGMARFLPGCTVLLRDYGEQDAVLQVRTPAHLERPQRLVLALDALPAEPYNVDPWDTARYLWDDRATGDLLYRLGGGDRLPFHRRDGRRLTPDELPSDVPPDGDPVALTEWIMQLQDVGLATEAWEAAGVNTKLPAIDPDLNRWQRRSMDAEERIPAIPALLRAVRGSGPKAVLRPFGRSYRRGNYVVTATADAVKVRHKDGGKSALAPSAPHVWWQRSPDLELLRLGHIGPADLHPLVRTALFPDLDPTPEAPGRDQPPTAVGVRCRGGWHRVGWRDGHLDALDHEPDEARRERVLRSLGGAVPPCFQVTDAWRGSSGDRLPRALQELRRHALNAIYAGDRDEFERLLDGGLDPVGILDRRKRAPLHLLAHLDLPGRPAADLVPRLVAAGLDPNAGNASGRRPLHDVLFDGGSAELVQALVLAGADPRAKDDLGCSALHLLRTADAARVLPDLLAAGLDLDEADEYGRPPLHALAIAAAPPESFHALLDAGADPGSRTEYEETSLVDLLEDRPDLAFVLAAARAALGDDE